MNRKLMRGAILTRYGTMDQFANEVLGVKGATLSVKIHNDSFTIPQIVKIVDALDLDADDVFSIFFADAVGKIPNR